MSIKAPYLPYDRLVAIANEFLREHHPSGDIPVPIEEIIDVEFGIDIVPVPGLYDSFEIDASITNDLATIYVDEYRYKRVPNRYRFSLAHELAHRIIHPDIFCQLTYSTIAEWKKVIASIPADQYGWIEQQAYNLGGLLLVPPTALADCFARLEEAASGAGLNLKELEEKAKRVAVENLGRHFHVSSQVIARRLEKDRLWDCP